MNKLLILVALGLVVGNLTARYANQAAAPTEQDMLAEAMGPAFIARAEAFSAGLDGEFAEMVSRIDAYEASDECKAAANLQAQVVSIEAASMMDLVLKSSRWVSLDEEIEAYSARYFELGCPLGLGTQLLARKSRTSLAARSIVSDALEGMRAYEAKR